MSEVPPSSFYRLETQVFSGTEKASSLPEVLDWGLRRQLSWSPQDTGHKSLPQDFASTSHVLHHSVHFSLPRMPQVSPLTVGRGAGLLGLGT